MDRIKMRPPSESDLPSIVEFEIEIARISFPDDPILDPEVHHKKLAKALERDIEGMFVAEDTQTGEIVGWLWVALNTNFLTGEQYATFRSLAVAHGSNHADGSAIAETIFAHGIEYAKSSGVTEITGKVHVNNIAMRVIYRKFGFEAEHLSMKKMIQSKKKT
jgi:ribosomal protein S18 acetylase RimI-like enzyme